MDFQGFHGNSCNTRLRVPSLCEMSVPFSGQLSRSAGIISSIVKELKNVNLKFVKNISVQFDPFHEKSRETRDFLFHISAPRVQATNTSCVVKTKVVCDHSEPTVTFKLETGEKIIFKCLNLTALNILQLCNKHISSQVPIDPAVVAAQEELAAKKKKRKLRPKRLYNPEGKHRPFD